MGPASRTHVPKVPRAEGRWQWRGAAAGFAVFVGGRVEDLMRQSLRLGRIAGIAVGVHWSVLVIMALLVQGLAVTVLPGAAPGQPRPVYWAAAIGRRGPVPGLAAGPRAGTRAGGQTVRHPRGADHSVAAGRRGRARR